MALASATDRLKEEKKLVNSFRLVLLSSITEHQMMLRVFYVVLFVTIAGLV